MSLPVPRILSVIASAWLSAHGSGCTRGDIVLGTASAPPYDATSAAPTPMVMQGAAGAPGPSEPSAAASGFAQPPPAATVVHMRGQGPAVTNTPPVSKSDQVSDAGPMRPDTRRSNGCGKAPAQISVVDAQGQPENVLLDVPASYDNTRAYPLVLAFHSSDTSSDTFRSELNLNTIADAVIAYPNPMERGRQFQRDLPMTIDQLIAQLTENYCVDLDRLFAMGDGAGALAANMIGCTRGEQIRAIATLSNAPPPPGPCFGNAAVWLLQRSDAEPMMVGAGMSNRDFWATRNGCDVFAPKPVSPQPCVEYSGCAPGRPVHFCEYLGAQWPSFAVSGAWAFFESF